MAKVEKDKADILNELDEVQKTIDVEPNLDSPTYYRARSAWQNNIAEAKIRKAALLSELQKELLANGVAIFLIGPAGHVEEFKRIANEESSVLNIAADGLYQRLAQRIEPALGAKRTFSANENMMLISALREVGIDLKLESLSQPQLMDVAHPENFDALVDLVRSLVRGSATDELNRVYIEDAVGKEGYAVRYKGTVVPVILTGATAEEIPTLSVSFKRSANTINIDQEVTVDKTYVLDQFQDIMKQLKKKK